MLRTVQEEGVERLRELHRRLHARFGVARVNIVVGYGIYVLLAVGVTVLATWLVVQSRIDQLDAGAGVDASELANTVWRHTLSLVLGLCLVGLSAIWFGIVHPFEAFRSRTRAKLADRSLEQQVEALSAQLGRKSEQLRAALEDNAELRAASKSAVPAFERGRAVIDALMATATDALLLADPEGRVVDLTPFACELLGYPRGSAAGRPVEQVMRLFDERRPNPRDYPLGELTAQTLASASSLPRVQTALLVDRADRETPVVVTFCAVVDAHGQCVGATIRIVRSGATAGQAPVKTLADSLSRSELEAGTGASRVAFERRLDELVRLAQAREASHGLLLLRIDRLAAISDTYGYEAAEELTRKSAQIVRDQLVGTGECYPLSADRLAILLPFRNAGETTGVAEMLREAVSSRELVWKGRRLAATASIAIVDVEPDGEGRVALMEAAEAVLASTALAGNVVRRLEKDQALSDRRREDRDWLTWIEPRLEDGRAHFISQQASALSTDAPPLLECYLRIEDDDGVWLTPGAFMPALERHSRTSLVDLWILRSVLDQLERSAESVQDYGHICLNFAVESLLEPDFGARVFQILASTTVPARRLCFEFDERALALQPAAFKTFAETVRTAGAALALDRCRWTINPDLIREVRVEYVKFHESIVKRAMSDAFDHAQLSWLVSAARMLEIRTVACGVEDGDALERLKKMGVDYAQGVAVNKMGPLLA